MVTEEEFQLAKKALSRANLTDEDLDFIEQTITEYKSQAPSTTTPDYQGLSSGQALSGLDALEATVPFNEEENAHLAMQSAVPDAGTVVLDPSGPKKPKSAGGAPIQEALARSDQAIADAEAQAAVEAELKDPALATLSKFKHPELASEPTYFPKGDGQGIPWMEPSVEQFQAELGEVAAGYDENSDSYKVYADKKWKQARAQAMKQGTGIYRVSQMEPSLAMSAVESLDSLGAVFSGVSDAFGGKYIRQAKGGLDEATDAVAAELGVERQPEDELRHPLEQMFSVQSPEEAFEQQSRNPGATVAGTVAGSLLPFSPGMVAGSAAAKLIPGAGAGSRLAQSTVGGAAGGGAESLALGGDLDEGMLYGAAFGLGLGGVGEAARKGARAIERSPDGLSVLGPAEASGASLDWKGGVKRSPGMVHARELQAQHGLESPELALAREAEGPLAKQALKVQGEAQSARNADADRYLQEFGETKVPAMHLGSAVFEELNGSLRGGQEMFLGSARAQALRRELPKLWEVAQVLPSKSHGRAALESLGGKGKIVSRQELQALGYDDPNAFKPAGSTALPENAQAFLLRPKEFTPNELENQIAIIDDAAGVNRTSGGSNERFTRYTRESRRDRDQFPNPQWLADRYKYEIGSDTVTGWSAIQAARSQDIGATANLNRSAGLPEKVPDLHPIDVSNPATADANRQAALPDMDSEAWKKFRHTIAGLKRNGGTDFDAIFALARGAGLEKEVSTIIATRLEGKLDELVSFTGRGISNRGLLAGALDASKFRSLPTLRKAQGAGQLAPPAGVLGEPELEGDPVSPLSEADIVLLNSLVKASSEKDPAAKARLLEEVGSFQKIGMGLAGNPLEMLMGLVDPPASPSVAKGGGDPLARRTTESGLDAHPMFSAEEGFAAPKYYLENVAAEEEKSDIINFDPETNLARIETGDRFQADRIEDHETFWNNVFSEAKKRKMELSRENVIWIGADMIHDPRLLLEFLNHTEDGGMRQSQPFTIQEIRSTMQGATL